MSESFIVKARGLPWSATPQDVIEFLSDAKVLNGEKGIHFTYNKEGKASGEVFVELETKEDLESAMGHDKNHMGKRYIELKEANECEMKWVIDRMPSNPTDVGNSDGVVRMRGLPFGCSKPDIAEFFQGLQITPYGITITMDRDGRASGDAYVEFATTEDAEKALGKHKEKIGHRYIELFQSSKVEIKHVIGCKNDGRQQLMNVRPGPYDRPPLGGSRARGRGGNLGPSGFNSGSYGNNYSYGNSYDNYDGGMRGYRGGKSSPMRGGRSGGGGMGNRDRSSVQNSKTGHSIHMRGLPFEATTQDVMKFFHPVNTVDVRILMSDHNGRPKGECDVDFSTHCDAEQAMSKDKQNMGHRYIELFIQSASASGGSGYSGGNAESGSGGWSGNNSSMSRDGPQPMMGRGNNVPSGYGGGYNNMGGGGSNSSSGNMGGNNTRSGYGGNQDSYTSGYSSFNDVSYPSGQQSGQQSAGGNNGFYGESLH
jgi:heterogeneous nuclear ribonucleoprotein F/H